MIVCCTGGVSLSFRCNRATHVAARAPQRRAGRNGTNGPNPCVFCVYALAPTGWRRAPALHWAPPFSSSSSAVGTMSATLQPPATSTLALSASAVEREVERIARALREQLDTRLRRRGLVV